MDDKARQALKESLLQRRRELIEEGDVGVRSETAVSTERADEDTRPLAEMNKVINSRRNRVRVQELAGIERALQKMKQEPEEYGRCVDCDEWIPMGRLKLMPWALRCVRCESEHSGPRHDGRRRHALDFVD